ncbi:hypothetical protein PF049_00275 [Erythrobacteraceae bacterium WH01K]|nr:hypothetical protein PF049_00275 [Erythrobacteraceae bacterium WH01K]
MEWILLICIILTGLAFWSKAYDENRALEFEAAKAERKALKEKKQAEIDKDLVVWMTKIQREGWSLISRGRLMHLEEQPHCIIALSNTSPLLRVNQIDVQDEFSHAEPIYINLREIISLNVARPSVRRSRQEKISFPITETQRRSPVARGLIGGALLGPAGLVVGVASGLNSQITTSVKSETVNKEYDGLGDPQLIIGTNREDHPYFKIKCANQEVADEWVFRIRGRQNRLSRTKG